MKVRGILLLICLMVPYLYGRAAVRQNFSVLYVGGSPNCGVVMGMAPDSVKLAASAKERSADFSRFLKSRFRKVKSVDAGEYDPAMSEEYDVTVFDAVPPRDVVFPEGFDRPSVCIAEVAPAIGRSFGSKNDWYCLCLQNKALGWDKNHPIFKGPYKVDIRSEVNPAPAGAVEYAGLYGEEVPDSVEMWTVQTLNYTDDPEIRVGLVCRPWGYDDSPDAEVISGGVSSKSIDAVAIGRHGNFFHWGFGASPSGLTESGRNALANSIVYMASMGPRRIIARKLKENIATRNSVSQAKGRIDRRAWQTENDARMHFYLKVDSGQRAVKAKIEAGAPLTLADSAYMSIPPQRKPKPMPYAEFIRQHEPELFHIFGEDIEAYNEYYDKNTPWFYPAGKYGEELDIDEDVRSLGVANNDVRMLDKCVALIADEDPYEADKARRILERYTLCRFETPAEWRGWLDAVRDRLFFTESGGWLWLVDSDDPTQVGNDYSVLTSAKSDKTAHEEVETTEAVTAQNEVAETDRENPVAVTASVRSNADDTRDVVLTMVIHQGFHLYANLDQEDPFVPTTVTFRLPDGVEAVGEMRKPDMVPTANATTYYVGTCEFVQTVKGDSDKPIEIEVSYQSCDDAVCLRPVSLSIEIFIV